MKSVDPGILSKSVCFSFTPSELAQKLFFYPTWCGHYYCTKNYFMKRQTYPPLLIIFIRAGKLHVEYEHQCFDAEKGDVVLLDCSNPHYYHAYDGLEFLYMHFDGSNSHELCRHILDNKGALIQGDSNLLIGKLLYNMVYFYQNGGIESMFQSSMRIYHVFEYLLSPPGIQSESLTAIEESIHYIKDNYNESLSINILADIASLSPYYYAHCFKDETGFSPMEYVTNTRLEHAKIELVRTQKNVEEIADTVGYSSSSSFINMFRKKTGMSPKQYRKLHLSGSKENI